MVNATLQTLKLTQGQAITTIKDIAYLSTERIQNNLTKKVEEVHDLRTEIQELLFDVKNKQQEIIQQGKEIEEHVNLIKTIHLLNVMINECKHADTSRRERKRGQCKA